MTALTEHGAAVRSDLSARYGISPDAVQAMMEALVRGGGTQAQFDISELGGMGQWSWGGMTMVGDMFNTNLQALVSNLCGDISQAMQAGPLFQPASTARGSWQGQSQGLGQASGGMGQGLGLGMGAGWWPAELGQPSSQGSQNDLSYAVFPQMQRLAINLAGRVTVYDTGAHEIGGVSQQQSGGASWTFTSQYGTVDLSSLPVVPARDPAPVDPEPIEQAPVAPEPAPAQDVVDPDPPAPVASQPEDAPAAKAPVAIGSSSVLTTPEEIFSALERLGGLRDLGILTPEEFDAKKQDLLARL